MSSFICSSKHFNSIESAVIGLTIENNFYFPYSFREKVPQLYRCKEYSGTVIDQTVRIIIDSLRELNALCVSLQYKHHFEGVLNAEIREQLIIVKDRKEKKHLTKIGLYKALQCVNYQIEIEHLKELRELTKQEEMAMFLLKK